MLESHMSPLVRPPILPGGGAASKRATPAVDFRDLQQYYKK